MFHSLNCQPAMHEHCAISQESQSVRQVVRAWQGSRADVCACPLPPLLHTLAPSNLLVSLPCKSMSTSEHQCHQYLLQKHVNCWRQTQILNSIECNFVVKLLIGSVSQIIGQCPCFEGFFFPRTQNWSFQSKLNTKLFAVLPKKCWGSREPVGKVGNKICSWSSSQMHFQQNWWQILFC